MEEVITPETLSDAPQLSAADGNGADRTGSISLEALSGILGKDFQDVDSALKSVKDTYSYVGSQAKYREEVANLATALGTDEQGVLSTIKNLMDGINNSAPAPEPAVAAQNNQEGFVSKEQYQADMFFSKNENIAEIREELSVLKDNFGADQSWSDFIASERAQKLITPINGYREMEAQKSVLESNPRIGMATDKLSDAQKNLRESQQRAQAGDIAGANQAEYAARSGAVSSVIDAFGLK